MKSTGPSDIWIAKYNPRNQLVWAKKAGGKGRDVAESIALSSVKFPADAPYRDVYITGTIQVNNRVKHRVIKFTRDRSLEGKSMV